MNGFLLLLFISLAAVTLVRSTSPVNCENVVAADCTVSGCACGKYIAQCGCELCFKCADEVCSFVAGEICQSGYSCKLPDGLDDSHKFHQDGTCKVKAADSSSEEN